MSIAVITRRTRPIVTVAIRFYLIPNDFCYFCLVGPLDAVAAGTVGAWTSLAANDVTTTSSSSFPSVISEDSLASLVVFLEGILNHCSTASIDLNMVQAQAVASFAFGLACGSASCLQEENSVVDPSDVNTLFEEMIVCPPEIIPATSIR